MHTILLWYTAVTDENTGVGLDMIQSLAGAIIFALRRRNTCCEYMVRMSKSEMKTTQGCAAAAILLRGCWCRCVVLW